MDLVGYDRATFDAIVEDYRRFAADIGIGDFLAIPVSGLKGDNISTLSDATPWYNGSSLVEHLETVEVDAAGARAKPFRSEERRVGKECVSTCRSRWSPYN